MIEFGKIAAFVTGGGSGIGLALAEELAARGARVAVAGTTMARLDAATARIREAGGEAIAVLLDVADAERWPAALDEAEAALGPIGLLCLNAAVSPEVQRIEDTPLDLWRRIVDVNLNGLFYGARAWIPRARSRGNPAHLMVTGSMTALAPMPGIHAYGASKAGAILFTELLRSELADSPIGVSLLHPGPTRTDIVETRLRLYGRTELNDRDRAVIEMLAASADPAKVASFALDAAARGEFHICPHIAHKPTVERRFAEVLDAMHTSADEGERNLARPRLGD